jgi:hypothetical protein
MAAMHSLPKLLPLPCTQIALAPHPAWQQGCPTPPQADVQRPSAPQSASMSVQPLMQHDWPIPPHAEQVPTPLVMSPDEHVVPAAVQPGQFIAPGAPEQFSDTISRQHV